MMRPVMTATQVTQQVSGLLVSSSMSLRQQHKHTTYTARTSRLTPRPTAPTHARIIKDWRRSVERRKKVPEKQRCHLLKSWLRCDFTLKNMSRAFQQTASANIKRVKEYVWSENVRLADLNTRKVAWQPISIKQHLCVEIFLRWSLAISLISSALTLLIAACSKEG